MTLEQLFSIRVYHGYIFQILLAEMLFLPVLEKRKRFVIRFIFGLIGYVFVSLLLSNFINSFASGFNSLSIFIVSLGFCYLIFKNKFKDTLFCCVGGQFIQNLSHNIEMLIYLPLKGYFNNVGWFFLSFGVMISIYVLAYFVIIRHFIADSEISIHSAGVFGIAIASALFCYLVQYLFQVYEIDQYFVTTIPFIFCDVVSLVAQFGLLAYRKRIEENTKLESYINRESKMYENFKDTIDIINMKAHDLKHFINDLDKQKLEDFDGKEEIEAVLDDYDHQTKTGNAILDTVLTEKILVCEKDKIEFSMMAEGESLSFLKNSDIASIFGNLLSNAIEYEKKIEDKNKRFILLKVQKKGMVVSIHVENYCEDEIVFSNNLPLTTKKNKNDHGFGLKSVKYIVSKYSGILNISCSDNLFKVDIVFPFVNAKQVSH